MNIFDYIWINFEWIFKESFCLIYSLFVSTVLYISQSKCCSHIMQNKGKLMLFKCTEATLYVHCKQVWSINNSSVFKMLSHFMSILNHFEKKVFFVGTWKTFYLFATSNMNNIIRLEEKNAYNYDCFGSEDGKKIIIKRNKKIFFFLVSTDFVSFFCVHISNGYWVITMTSIIGKVLCT